MERKTVKVGIIGGGAAGLAAAYEMIKQGHQPEVFERAPFLGGQASTFQVGGGRLERGYHHLFMSDQDMVNLISEIGLGHKLQWIESRVGFFCNGKIWPFVTPKDLLAFKPLSMIDRFRLGLVTLYLRRYKNWRILETQTASAWCRRMAGEKVYNVLLGPMLRGKFGEYHDVVSMAWLWNKFVLRAGSRGKGIRGAQKEQLGYPMGSFGEVFDTVGQYITNMGGEVHTAATVQQIVVSNGQASGLKIQLGNNEKAEVRDYDAVIATVPSLVFPKLLPEMPSEYLKKLTGVTYLAAVLIVLVLDRPFSDMYWLNIADRSIPFVGIIEQTNFVDKSIYGGKHIVYISNYLSRENPLYHKQREDLLAEYLPHLKRINPKFDQSWIQEYFYHREEAAQPVITTNYSHNIPDTHTPFRRLYLANTTQIYPEDRGTNYSVRLGRNVARMVARELG